MKLLILFLAVFGLSTAAVLPSGEVLSRNARSLEDDLNDFLVLIPTDKVLTILIQYFAEDAEFQAAVAYLQCDDFKALVVAVDAIPEYIAFLDYLQAGGLDVYKWVNMLHSWLGLSELSGSVSISRLMSARITGGVAGLVADIKAILPLAEIRALYHEKLATSEEFAALHALVSCDTAVELLTKLKATEEFQYMHTAATNAGLNIDAVFDLLKTILGWA